MITRVLGCVWTSEREMVLRGASLEECEAYADGYNAEAIRCEVPHRAYALLHVPYSVPQIEEITADAVESGM